MSPTGSRVNHRIAINNSDDSDLDVLIKELSPLVDKENLLFSEEFEKDDDSNGHMDFVAAAANIRAIYFKIEPKDKLEIKRITGKIISAIATTTAMICGLVTLEMYKVHCIDKKKISDYRFGLINLALPIFNISEPLECHNKECPANGLKFNLWDRWIIEGDITLGEFFKKVKEQYKVEVSMVTVGNSVIDPIYEDMKKGQARLQSEVTDILKKRTQHAATS